MDIKEQMTTTSLPDRLKVAARSRVAPFIAMDVLARANGHAAAGRDVIHLEVGEPGTGAPAPVLAAARRALESGRIGYTEALGRPALRAAIAGHYRRSYDLALEPERVVVTVGASGAFVLGFLAMFDPGDRVIVPEPAFPAYKNILRALGIDVVRLGLDAASNFKPTVATLQAVPPPIHGLIVASPANPTGTMLERSELASIAAFCRARGIRLIVDEIYHGITYDRPASTVLELDPDAVVINGFSKYFCMTGWRLGWLVAPPDLVRPIELLAQNLFISPPALAQEAALAAFACRDELDARVETYRRSRAALLDWLPQGGLDRFAPVDGAFYLYADVSRLTEDSQELCASLLEATGVALTPGADFDGEAGRRHLRIAFAGDPEQIARGAKRLTDWLKARR
jgi:aspartate/methionine/tyrosine aminotransferase